MRFSENNNQLFLAENNRISTKSVAGGIHIDDKGVYINPFVEKIKITGNIAVLGLAILNKTDYDTLYGGTNQLGLIREIIFRFPDGQLLKLKVNNQETKTDEKISYNAVTHSAAYEKFESGIVPINREDLERIASAQRFSCKITGSKNSVIYEEKDIEPGFQTNLKKFYSTYVQ